MSWASTDSVMPSSSKVSTYLRHEIMNGTRPGPWKARLVMRGKTSPVEMARSDMVPSRSPWASTTGSPII